MSFTEPDPVPEPSGPSEAELAATARSAQLERENTFLRAGVDVNSDDPKVKLLVDSVANDNALTIETVKDRAKLLGLGEAPPPDTQLLDGEQGQGAERQTLGNAGQVEPDPGDVDPKAESRRLAIEARSAGASEENALATGIHALMVAGMTNKDPRVFAQNNGG